MITVSLGALYGVSMWWTLQGGKPMTSQRPIVVDAVLPLGLGERRFELRYRDFMMPEGIQQAVGHYRMLRRGRNTIFAEAIDWDCAICLEPLTRDWMKYHFPYQRDDRLFDGNDQPIESEFIKAFL